MPLTDSLIELLKEEEARKAAVGSKPGLYSNNQPLSFLTPQEETKKRNAALDFLGQTMWEAVNTGLFDVPELLLPEDIKKTLEPQTIPGKVGAAIGSTIGFIGGAPMKIVGKGAVKLALKPFIKGGLKKIEKDVVKDIGEKVISEKARKFIAKDAMRTVGELAPKPGFEAKLAKNWTRKVTEELDKQVLDAIARDEITQAEGKLISSAFKRHVVSRPVQDFSDIIMKSFPNKFGYTVGKMVEESVRFGTIDAVMEGVHSTEEGRAYDPLQPILGAAIGSGFGALSWMAPKGKASLTKSDFLSGLRGVLGRNPFSKMSEEQLIKHSKWLGDELKHSGENTLIRVGNAEVNLLDPQATLGSDGVETLRGALSQIRATYGKRLMKWAVEEEWASTKDNWQRMVAGTLIMNATTVAALAQGQHVPMEDILTSVILGAYLNRRGMPRAVDMFPERMQKLRGQMFTMGDIDPKGTLITPRNKNVMQLPSFNFEHIDPLRDPGVKKLLKIGDEFNLSEVSNEDLSKRAPKGKSAALSEKDLDLFKEYYSYYIGASGKRYIVPMDAISEKEALQIQDRIKDTVLEGKKITDAETFRDIMTRASNAISDNVIQNMTETTRQFLADLGIPANEKGTADLGLIPQRVYLSPVLKEKARNGELAGLKDKYETADIVERMNKLMQSNFELMSATRDYSNDGYEIKDEVDFANATKHILDSERNLIGRYNLDPAMFSYKNIDRMMPQLLYRSYQKSIDNFSEIFDMRKNPEANTLQNLLVEAGILIPEKEDPKRFGQYNLIGNVQNQITVDRGDTKGEFAGDKEERILTGVHNMLAAKKYYGKIDNVTERKVKPYQIQKLIKYLESRKINTNNEYFTAYAQDAAQRVEEKILQDTKVGKHTNLIGNLMNTKLGNIGGFVTYGDPQVGGAYFVAHKIKMMDPKLERATVEYNRAIEEMIKDGKKVSTGEKAITLGEDIVLTDISSAQILSDIVRASKLESRDEGAKALVEFVKTMNPNDTLRNAIITLQNRISNPDRILSMMSAAGVVTSEKKGESIKWNFDRTKFAEPKVRETLFNLISKYGVTKSDIEVLQSDAAQRIDNLMKYRYTAYSKQTQQQFFNKYFPTSEGEKPRTAEEQQEYISSKLYENDTISENAIHNLMGDMKIKIDNEHTIMGKELVENKNKYPRQYIETLNDVIALIAKEIGSEPVDLVYYNRGVRTKKIVLQKDNIAEYFKKNDLQLFLFDGEMSAFVSTPDGRKKTNRSINVFEAEADNREESVIRRNEPLVKTFEDAIKLEGYATIPLGNGKNAVGIKREEASKIRDLFKEQIYDKYDESERKGTIWTKINTMMEDLNKVESWGSEHEEALRSLLIMDMNGKETFNRLLLSGKSEIATLAKRFSLYHTPSSKNINLDFVKSIKNTFDKIGKKKDAALLDYYMKKGKATVISWNDERFDTIRNEVEPKLPEGYTWDEISGGREAVSRFDSITYINPKNGFARFLSITQGHVNDDRALFKPIISSNEPGAYLYGKTLFVVSPEMDPFFEKNPDVDMVMAGTADKMKSIANAGLQIDASLEDVMKKDSSEIKNYYYNIPLEKIGIVQAIGDKKPARESDSLFNYMSSEEVDSLYKLNGYEEKLKNALENMKRILADPLESRSAFLRMSGFDPNLSFDELATAAEQDTKLGNIVRWLASSPEASPMAFGTEDFANLYKNFQLDNILKPQSVINVGGENVFYGGRSVLINNPSARLSPSLAPKSKGERSIKGEIELPDWTKDQKINFGDKKNVVVVNAKTGEVRNLDKLYLELLEKAKVPDGEQALDMLKNDGTLGQLVEELKWLSDTTKEQWDVGIVLNRYPRNKPNDLTILRLKGFLDPRHGNAINVNSFDVMGIFEGDYDKDEIDFFWGNSPSVIKHIEKSSQFWVNPLNPDVYEAPLPNVELLGVNHTDSARAFRRLDANNRVYKKMIGVVQKTMRMLTHLKDLGTKNKETGRFDLIKTKNASGEEVVISIDMDNDAFYQRFALESQMIIDYWNGVPSEIMKNMESWRRNFLFEDIDKTIPASELATLKRSKDHAEEYSVNPENTKKVRIFYKTVDGKETGLSDLDKDIIYSHISEFGRLLDARTEVYNSGGASKTAKYNDIIERSERYFAYMGHKWGLRGDNNINRNIYYKLRGKYRNNADFDSYFKPKYTNRSFVNKYDYITDEMIEKNRRKYQYEINGANVFTTEFTRKAGLISEGKAGSLIERIFHTIASNDPFDLKRNLTYEEGMIFERTEMLAGMLYGGDRELENAIRFTQKMPKALGTFYGNVRYLRSLVKFRDSVKNNAGYNWRAKKKMLNTLDTKIASVEESLDPVLSEKYKKSHDLKDLINIRGMAVDIQGNEDILRSTATMYTIQALTRNHFPRGVSNNKWSSDMRELKQMVGKVYGNFFTGSTRKYNAFTELESRDTLEEKLNPVYDHIEAEKRISEKMDEIWANLGYQNGLLFMLQFANPAESQLKYGVYNNKVISIAAKKDNNFRRMVRFLFRKYDEAVDPEERKTLRTAIEALSKYHAAYFNILGPGAAYVPIDDMQYMVVHRDPPSILRKIVSIADRYDSSHIDRGEVSRGVLGQGVRYKRGVDTLKQLYRDIAGTEGLFDMPELSSPLAVDSDAITGEISYMTGLLTGNRYTDPISYSYVSDRLYNKMKSIGLDRPIRKMFSAGSQDEVTAASLETEGLGAFITGSSGLSVDPFSAMTLGQKRLLSYALRMGADMKETTDQKLYDATNEEKWRSREEHGNCKAR